MPNSNGMDAMASVDDRKQKRQARMAALVGRRGGTAAKVSGGEVTTRDRAKGFLTGPEGQQHRKSLARIYRVMTDTPADETGMVEGTPFSKAGVATLIATLDKRAANESAPGAKMAGALKRVLTNKAEDEGESVHGVSVAKLQKIAEVLGKLKQKRAAKA